MSLRHFQQKLTGRLLLWSGASIAGGVALKTQQEPHRAFGEQCIAWGAVDGAIALVGRRLARERAESAILARNLRRLLWLNTALDIGYIAFGAHLLRRGQAQDNLRRQGQGAGIILQGTFLFLFDLHHARQVPARDAPSLVSSDQ